MTDLRDDPGPAGVQLRPDDGFFDAGTEGYLPASVPRGGHELPPLPYSYDALEPFISAKILRIHHLTHHAAYIDGLNLAELALVEARMQGDFALVRHWERELAFNGSGDILHTLYWLNMTPRPPNGPPPGVQRLLERDYGSLEKFQRHFAEAAARVAGSGWAALVWQPEYGRSEILAPERHENMTQWGVIPLLIVDVWEHAYYLQYQARRREYLDAWWQVVDWYRVQQRLVRAVDV